MAMTGGRAAYLFQRGCFGDFLPCFLKKFRDGPDRTEKLVNKPIDVVIGDNRNALPLTSGSQ
jgi:hypothetical protein